MKKLIIATLALTFVGLTTINVNAGDREWATVGKVLTGVAAGAVLAHAVNSHADVTVSYNYTTPRYCAPARVVYAPRPVVVCRPPVVCAASPALVHRVPVVVRTPVYVQAYRGNGYPYRHGWSRSHRR